MGNGRYNTIEKHKYYGCGGYGVGGTLGGVLFVGGLRGRGGGVNRGEMLMRQRWTHMNNFNCKEDKCPNFGKE